MTTPNTGEVFRNGGVLYYGTVDQVADIPVGYVPQDEPVEVTYEVDQYDMRVQEVAGDVIRDRDYTAMMIATNAFQVEPGNVAAAMGLDNVATPGEFQIGGETPTAQKLYSWRFITTRRDGSTVIYDIPAATPSEELALAFSRTEWTKIPLNIKSLDGSGRGASAKFNGGSVQSTIAAGVLTRVGGIGYARVFGEGAAADVLDSIAADATPLVDEEKLHVQLGSVLQPITLTHLAGTLELQGDIDWLMDKIGDYILLQYDLAGTKWVEIGRYDSPY